MIGFNTNGDDASTIQWIHDITNNLSNSIKNIVLISHKSGHVFPNAHHPAEAKDIYSAVENIPDVKVYEISGHNHNLASTSWGLWFISGAGGKSHYSCGTNNQWNFCDDSHFGFLELVIDNNNGNINTSFYDKNNNKLH